MLPVPEDGSFGGLNKGGNERTVPTSLPGSRHVRGAITRTRRREASEGDSQRIRPVGLRQVKAPRKRMSGGMRG